MEFNTEIDEKFTELSTSRDLQNEPEKDKSAMELKLAIKEEFVEGGQRYVQSQLVTSLDHKELKNEPEEDSSDMGVKVEIKEEFAEDEQGYVESLLITPHEIRDLKNEPCEDNLGTTVM
uniref:Uncharacterized protein LOC114345539 isoform X2 n=1 Tax=Diabrotica virgifera virgifera TaxID=50390 RepID=A0A6P7GRJ6_DIAVI